MANAFGSIDDLDSNNDSSDTSSQHSLDSDTVDAILKYVDGPELVLREGNAGRHESSDEEDSSGEETETEYDETDETDETDDASSVSSKSSESYSSEVEKHLQKLPPPVQLLRRRQLEKQRRR